METDTVPRPSLTSAQLRRLIISTFLGSTLEAFDFIVYALLTPVAFNPLFFPDLSPEIATIASLSVIAVGIMARPLGGVFFGHIGDRVGRKLTVVMTISLMGVATAVIGLLPTYNSIGVAAPAVLTILRFLQGFAYGGENSAAPVYVAESSPPNRRGLYTSWCASGLLAGVLLSSVVVGAVARLSTADMLSWGWRLPFLLSVAAVVVSLYIRLQVVESPAFITEITIRKPFPVPVIEVLRAHKLAAFIATVVSAGVTSTFYFTSVFGLSYAIETLHLSKSTLLLGISIGNVIGVATTPLFGFVSDLTGRRVVMSASFVATALYVPLAFFPLLQSGDFLNVVLAMAVPGAIIVPLSFGTSYIFFAELFADGRVRCSGVALGKQVGNALGGGLLPVVSAGMVALNAGQITYVMALFVTINLVALATTYLKSETKDTPI